MISVVIPVKDGGDELAHCLDAISAQDISDEVEVVAVDSGSSDDSVAVASSRGARVYEIAAASFNHGAARNLGARHSIGDVLVFLSQDAVPVDDQWLARLIRPLREEPDIAGVYGGQLPRHGTRPPERYFLGFLYGSSPRRQRAGGESELSMDTTLFSNVNGAMLRAMWERFPFVEDIVMSEDQEWSRRVLLAGHGLAYEPAAAVYHSHNYTLVSAFRRFFDSGMSADRAYLAGRTSGRALRRAAIRYAVGEAAWLLRTGQVQWIPYAALYEGVKLLGLVLGINHGLLPVWLKRRFSALPDGWIAR